MKNIVNIGVVGISGRGSSMLRELLNCEGVRVPAVCDKYSDRAEHGAEIVKEATGETADVYLDYKQLLAREDLDAVMCCTTWITHSRIAIDAMRAGKHVAIEVGGAASIEECWQMVRASEETGKFCMLLENCCYDRKEMAEELKKASPFLRSELAKRMDLRNTPELRFEFDESTLYGEHIDEILQEIHSENRE